MPLFHKWFHKWEYFTDWQRDETLSGGCVVNAQFRHCKQCGRWEQECGSWGGDWWQECLEPFGIEKLQLREIAIANMHAIRLHHDRWTVIDGH